MKLPLLILAWNVLSFIWTVSIACTLQSASMVAVGVMLCWVATRYACETRWAVFALLVINIVIAMLQVCSGHDIIPQGVGPSGVTGNKNLLASLIVSATPIVASVTWLAWITSFMMLVETSSKASFFALAGMLVYWVWWKIAGVKIRCAIAALFICAGIMLLVIGMYGYAGTPKSYTERLVYARNSVFIGMQRPLVGYGAGTGGWIYYYFQEPVVKSFSAVHENRWPRRLHNDWIQAFVELGFIGLALYMAILVRALMRGRNTAAGCALFALSLNALMDFPLQLPIGCWMWWVLVGLCYAKKGGT